VFISSLQNVESVSIDLKGAAHYFKLAADQGDAIGQYNYGHSLQNGENVSKDFKDATYSYKLAAHEGHSLSRWHFSVCVSECALVCSDPKLEADYFEFFASLGYADD
jgi:TPR repeat protein